MRGERRRAAALFDVGDGGDKNDDENVFVGGVVVVVGVLCANMYGRKPALQSFVKRHPKTSEKFQTVPRFPSFVF